MKKLVSLVLTTLMAVMILATTVAAKEGGKTVTVRIEGIEKNVFYDVLETDAATVGELFSEINDLGMVNIKLTEGFYGLYVSGVNGENEAAFQGYDGWMYMVNSVVPSVGISECELKDNDSVVLYYSDQYGVGFQYPQINTDDIENGKITITSMDTVYDENYNASVVENPVANATFSWDGKKYVPDDNGIVNLDMSAVTDGEHYVEIEKKSENGIPMVLRFAPETMVKVTLETKTQPEETKPIDGNTADKSMTALILGMSIAGCAIILSLMFSGKKTYEA